MKRSIYLILNEETGHIKIGIGKSPEKRIKQLQTGSSVKLKLLYQREVEHASKVERNLHFLYSMYRLEGEWFDIPNISFKEIDDKITIYENNYKLLSQLENPFI